MKKYLEITPDMEKLLEEIKDLDKRAFKGKRINFDLVQEKHNKFMDLGHKVYIEMELITK